MVKRNIILEVASKMPSRLLTLLETARKCSLTAVSTALFSRFLSRYQPQSSLLRPLLASIIFCLMLFGLIACSSSNNQAFIAKDFGGTQSSLLNDLQRQGVQVVHLGQRFRVILPTDILFKPATTQLKAKYAKTVIVPLAQLIQNSQTHTRVTVTGYTDNIGSGATQKDLGKQYATTIAAFLWAQGIPLRQMKIVGNGNQNRVASNRPSTSHYNRRVEVEFWG